MRELRGKPCFVLRLNGLKAAVRRADIQCMNISRRTKPRELL
jgi:hypothetical protein